MTESIYPETLPYVVKASWLIKLICSFSIPLAIFILWGLSTSSEDRIIVFLLFFLSVFVIPYFLLVIFLTKTVLQAESITHINCLFMKKRIPYNEIDTLKIVGNGDVKLILTDGTSIQILCGTDKQTQVMHIIRSKVLCRLDIKNTK